MKFLQLLDEISLVEAAIDRYRQIFQAILQDPDINPKTKQELANSIDDRIKWAKTVLKKDDRIVWYLRYWRTGIMHEYSAITPYGDAFKKQINQMAKKANASPVDIEAGIAYLTKGPGVRELEHFMSMPVAGIQQIIFGWQTPQQIIAQMQGLEKEWVEDRERTIEYDESADVILDFKDGFAWWDLNKAYCEKEADAMGHCGNSPRQHSNDTILSLRKVIETPKGSFYTPVLTFILRNDGYLTEMKGRGNDKPAERYHKYIVALLRTDNIKGIIGGGYMPENNFSIDDLDTNTRDELIEEKPLLGGLWRIYEKEGKSDVVLEILQDMLSSHNITPSELEFLEGDTVQIESWKNLGWFAKYEAYDKAVESLFDALEKLEDLDLRYTTEDFQDVLRRLPDQYLNIMLKEFNIGNGERDAIIDELIELLHKDRSHRFVEYVKGAILQSAVGEEAGVDQVRKILTDRIYDYVVDTGWPLKIHWVWLKIEFNEEEVEESKIYATIDFRDLVAIADEAGAEPDYAGDYSYASYDIHEYGWAGIDHEYISELRDEKYGNRQNPRTEEPLVTDDKPDPYSERVPVDGMFDPYLAAQILQQTLTVKESKSSPARGLRLMEFLNHVNLHEAAKDRYMQMFAPLTPLFQQAGLDYEFKTELANEVTWAMRVLKKSDKIMWYLRYIKFNILHRMSTGTAVGEVEEMFKPHYAKFLKQVAAKSGRPSADQWRKDAMEAQSRAFKEQMQHFMSLEIPAFVDATFGWETPREIIDAFTPIERAWQKKAVATVPHDPEATILIQFPDGSAWVDLEKNYCDAEARAMGHCGNAADPLDEDTVLSYRTIEEVEGRKLWKPRLTFILDKDTGLLGEMKGRANQKPDQKYHNVIIKLLQHPSIKGIGRGRWEVHNNFKMSDLPEDVAAKLIEEKPGLATVEHAYKVSGMTPDLLSRILKGFKDIDHAIEYEEENKHFVVERFPKGISQFIDSYYQDNSVIGWVNKHTLEGEYIDTGTYTVETSMKEDVLWRAEKMQKGTVEKIGNYFAVQYPDEVQNWEEGQGRELEIDSHSDVIAFIEEEFDHHDINDWLEWSHWSGSDVGTQDQMYTALMKHLNDFDLSHAGSAASLQFDDPDNNVRLTVDERAIASAYDEILADVEHGGWEEVFEDLDDMSEPHYGWHDFSEEAAAERFLEHLSELPEPEAPDPSEGKQQTLDL